MVLSPEQERAENAARAELIRKTLGQHGVNLIEQPFIRDSDKIMSTWTAENGQLVLMLHLNQYEDIDEGGSRVNVSIALEDREVNGITGFLTQRGKWVFATSHERTTKGLKLHHVFRQIAPEAFYDLTDQDLIPYLEKLAKVFLAGKAE